MQDPSFMERMWERGQEHLAAMHYTSAVRCLEAAEGAAWRQQDGVGLARLYLPLLEARRQIRYQAAEGVIVICGTGMSERDERQTVRDFIRDQKLRAGTLLLGANGPGRIKKAMEYVGAVRDAAKRQARWLEALLLVEHRQEVRIVSPGDAAFAGGLRVKWTRDAAPMVADSTQPDLDVPLPGPGRFVPGDEFHAMVRESLIVAWEALALKWQHRHPPLRGGDAWEEMAWLRLALRIDPACEPVTMRLIALGEAAGRAA